VSKPSLKYRKRGAIRTGVESGYSPLYLACCSPGWRKCETAPPARAGTRLFTGSRALAALTCAAGILLVPACGGTAAGSGAGRDEATASARSRQTVKIMARTIFRFGTVLVTNRGNTLYVFSPDDHRSVTCTGACAYSWPPLVLPAGATLVAGPGVTQQLLGSVQDLAGGQVVTYAGWPLYTYSGDAGPGQAFGQNIDMNGGEWYVMRPSGKPLIPAS
jgi:predicted lipoprotein with Yx(FWY)xxD motif